MSSASIRNLTVASMLGALGLLGVSVLSALAQDHPVSVDNATLREPLPGKNVTTAYFDVINASGKPRELVAVESGLTDRVELHQHRHEGGMMQMREVSSVALPPEATVRFEPGGYHIMLFGLSERPERGRPETLVLRFADGETVAVEAEVVSVMDGKGQGDDGHSHHHRH